MTDFVLPRLSDSMENGTIVTWLKTDGEFIEAGEDLVEIETDKATMSCPAETAGYVQILVREGETHPVGTPIARLTPEPAAGAAAPATESEAQETAASSELGEAAAPAASPARAAAETFALTAPVNGRSAHATPLARRVAAHHGLDLSGVVGSGPHGRITRADVFHALGLPVPDAELRRPVAAEAASPQTFTRTVSGGPRGDVTAAPLTRLQSLIAQRMAGAKAEAPHFQVQTEVRFDAAVALRAQLKAQLEQAPSLNDLVVRAAALALREHPKANGSFRGDVFEYYSRVNVGVAVAADGALVVPTIFDADSRSVVDIGAETRRLAAKVREGKIAPAELDGATFTVSNLGMYGMTAISPVVNVPQAAILGVGAAREVLVREDGEIRDRKLLTLTLSCDHRILYGAEAAEFLSAIRELLENPLRLLL